MTPPAPSRPPFDVVVLAASTGGIRALRQVRLRSAGGLPRARPGGPAPHPRPDDLLTGILRAGDGSLHDLLHRYTQALMVQLSQTVACNRLHTTEQRCARWLMQTRDRVGADEFELTQQFLAQMLGVRRGTVSLTAGVLQQAGVIRYSRGRITVADAGALHDAACECYDVVQAEFARLSGAPEVPG